MGAKYTHHYEAFGQEVLRSGFMQAEMLSHAVAIEARARALAARHVRTGQYEASFVPAHVEIKKVGGPGLRAVGIVENTDPVALEIEFGHTTEDGTHVEGQFILLSAMLQGGALR